MFLFLLSLFLGLNFLDPKLGNLVMNFRQNIGRVLSPALALVRPHNIDMDLNIQQTFHSNSVKLMSSSIINQNNFYCYIQGYELGKVVSSLLCHS